MALENAGPPLLPPAFLATYSGWCSATGDRIDEGDEIRADGAGGWQHTDCEDDDAEHPSRRQPPAATTIDEMGY